MENTTMKQSKEYYQNQRGQWVVRKQRMFGEAIRQMAEDRNGKVIFTCPNYAVILIPGVGELTLWAK